VKRQHWWSGSGRIFGEAAGPDSSGRQVNREPNLVHLALGITGLLFFAAIAFGVWHSLTVFAGYQRHFGGRVHPGRDFVSNVCQS